MLEVTGRRGAKRGGTCNRSLQAIRLTEGLATFIDAPELQVEQ